MEHLHDVVKNGKNGLQRLVEKIPGLKGYRNKEDRRDTDKLVRETAAKRFEEQWQRLSDIQVQLLKKANLSAMGELETGALRIRQLADRIRTAAYGYSGLFDAVKVDDNALYQLYDYDLYLFSLHDALCSAIDDVDAAIANGGDVATAVEHVNKVAQDCVNAYNRRSEVILGTVNS